MSLVSNKTTSLFYCRNFTPNHLLNFTRPIRFAGYSQKSLMWKQQENQAHPFRWKILFTTEYSDMNGFSLHFWYSFSVSAFQWIVKFVFRVLNPQAGREVYWLLLSLLCFPVPNFPRYVSTHPYGVFLFFGKVISQFSFCKVEPFLVLIKIFLFPFGRAYFS